MFYLFLSTLPVRGATEVLQGAGVHLGISIHAPREGSDRALRKGVTPCNTFLSTLPVRGATHAGRGAGHLRVISIHAPREGSDLRR